MKRRAKRALFGAVVFGAVLVVACWSTVRDHFQAWFFQLTRETKTIEPPPEGSIPTPRTEEDLIHFAAEQFRSPVIVDPDEVSSLPIRHAPRENVREYLEMLDWRVLEQRFPRRAYVLFLNHPPDKNFFGDHEFWDPSDETSRAAAPPAGQGR